MRINPVSVCSFGAKIHVDTLFDKSIKAEINPPSEPVDYVKAPIGNIYGAKINYSSHPNSIPLINFENYKAMCKSDKDYFRNLYRNFHKRPDIMNLFETKPESMHLPLQSEEEMDEFIKVSRWYNQFKEHPIICLGRSPKWFLNASLWMKDGIPDYKYTAFSGYWYRPDYREGMIRINGAGPTADEYDAYKIYLQDIKADPLSIVKDVEKKGKKAIITDYIETGKGMTSYMEVMGNFAKEQGVLDAFGKSFDIAKIGSQDYTLNRLKIEEVGTPVVHMPEILRPYSIPKTLWDEGEIKQTYYDMPLKPEYK